MTYFRNGFGLEESGYSREGLVELKRMMLQRGISWSEEGLDVSCHAVCGELRPSDWHGLEDITREFLLAGGLLKSFSGPVMLGGQGDHPHLELSEEFRDSVRVYRRDVRPYWDDLVIAASSKGLPRAGNIDYSVMLLGDSCLPGEDGKRLVRSYLSTEIGEDQEDFLQNTILGNLESMERVCSEVASADDFVVLTEEELMRISETSKWPYQDLNHKDLREFLS